MGGKVVNRGKIVRLQFRVVVKDLLLGHSSCGPAQHIPDGDAEPAHTRLSGPFSGLDPENEAHEAGRLLGLTRTADVVDAVVVTTALRQKTMILTGDRVDIERLVWASRREVAVVAD